jgi:hypothetical protein
MRRNNWGMVVAVVGCLGIVMTRPAAAQEMPPEYQAVLKTLAKGGDFKEGVLKVNIPRSDVRVTIGGRPAPTPFGFGGWIAFTKGDGGHDVMMGDLVLTEDEVNPVMSAVLANGLDVTALHNHFFWDSPRMYFMHVHGMGPVADVTSKIKPAIDLIDQAMKRAPAGGQAPSAAPTLDTAALAKIIGHPGEQTGPVFKITIGRPDINLREHGASINARMGLTPGQRSPGRMPTRWWPAIWPCWSARSRPS